VLEHLIGVARARGYRRLSLETGTTVAFLPARQLYASAGFTPCPPFGGYTPSEHNTFMTLRLDADG
jgi:putative acetyltransferase